MLRPMLFLLLSLLLLLSGCKVEMYSGLSEDQANQMLSTLLRRGIEAEKQAAGKNGYTLLVDDDQLVRALQVLKENSLPREAFKNLGEVFAGDGMISSTSEVQARMSYALSQELADTLSRIDGVLTARVHVVLGVNDKVNNITIAPSAAVFLRHTLDSPVVNLVPEIRELVAGAVASLKYDNVSVMLVPVRESVTVPDTKLPSPCCRREPIRPPCCCRCWPWRPFFWPWAWAAGSTAAVCWPVVARPVKPLRPGRGMTPASRVRPDAQTVFRGCPRAPSGPVAAPAAGQSAGRRTAAAG